MKKPIIKNWIKYFTGTLAVSGMLMVGGCDNNSSDRQENYETEAEVAENEVSQPVRENVSQEVEEVEEEPVQTADNAQQYDQMSNRSSAQRAQQIRDFDSHLEEHSEANREITKTLTDSENLEDGDVAGIHRGSTTTRGEVDSRDQNTYDRQSNTDLNDQESDMNQQGNMDQDDTATQQQNTYDQSTGVDQNTGATQQQNRLDQSDDAEIGQGTSSQQNLDDDMDGTGTTGITYDRQSNTDFEEDSDLNTQGQDSQIEVDTDDQGTTEMNTNTREDMDDTTPQHNAAADEDDPRYENDGDDPTRIGINEQQRESEFSNQEQGTTGTTQTDDTNMNQQGTSTTQTGTTGEGNADYENDGDDPTRTGINNQQDESEFSNQQQGTATQQETNTQQNEGQPATYHQQGNTEQMSQQEDGTGVVIYERYSITYPESYTDEDRQRTDDIMNEYETRRESMRGQVNEETGAYMAPEVDAEPKEGYDQLMREISENITYPQNAAAAELEGTVFVNFIVDEEGNIDEVKAVEDVIVPASSLKSATNPLDPTKFHEDEIEEAKEEMKQEAVRAVEATSGKWTPGQQAGENVKSEVQIPVHFNIENIQGTGNTIDNR